MKKCRSSSDPKTSSTSWAVASKTGVKWAGMVLTGRGAWPSGSTTNIGVTFKAPKAMPPV